VATLLGVSRLPRAINTAPCALGHREVRAEHGVAFLNDNFATVVPKVPQRRDEDARAALRIKVAGPGETPIAALTLRNLEMAAWPTVGVREDGDLGIRTVRPIRRIVDGDEAAAHMGEVDLCR